MTLRVVYTAIVLSASIVLCALMNARRVKESYPAFYRYVFFQAIAAAASLVITMVFYGMPMFWSYYILIAASGIFAAVVAHELGVKLLGPDGALPHSVNLRFRTMIGMGVAAALTVAMVLRLHLGGSLTHIMVKAEQWLAGALFVAFGAILIFWRTLRIFRRQAQAALICQGFVLHYAVLILAVFVRGRGSQYLAELSQQSGMIVNCLVLLWWSGVVLMKAPVFEKATGEKVQYVINEFQAARRAAIEAGVVPQ